MDKIFYFICLSLLTIPVTAQQQIMNISDALEPGEQKEYLLGAGAGDEINIRFERTGGSKLSSFSFWSYPNKTIFKENSVKKLKRAIVTHKKGVYRILLKNNTKKECRFRLKTYLLSKSKSPLTIDFMIRKDTAYAYSTTQLLPVKSEKTKALQKEQFYLNSRSNAFIKGGKDRIIFPVNLPANTLEWFYVFTASRNEEDIKNTLKTFDLAGSLTIYLKEDKSLQSAVSNLNAPPGADICDIYLLDENNARLFIENEEFEYDLSASRENYKSGVVKVDKNSENKLFLGINNPDNIYGIHISFEIIAIIEKEELVAKKVNIPVITSYLYPYIR